MNFQRPIITELGYDMSARVFLGEGNIVFTAVHIGKGAESQAPQELTAIVDKVLDATIISYSKQEKSIKIVFSFDNTNLLEGFNWTEYGIIARYDDGEGNTTEGLFCYGYDISDSPENIPRYTGANSYFKAKYNITIAVGNADSVTVDLREYSDYVLEEDLEEHLSANNPHGLNKEDVGLDRVENVSVDDATPSIVDRPEYMDSPLANGDTVSALWSKTKNHINHFIKHITSRNPHNITPAIIGAANKVHSHSAEEINSGILSIAHGGTGYDNISNFIKAIGLDKIKFDTIKQLDENNGYVVLKIKDLKVYYEWRRFTMTANAHSTAELSVYTDYDRFVAGPIPVGSVNTSNNTDTVSFSLVNKRGYTVYYHNNGGTRDTKFIYVHCFGIIS